MASPRGASPRTTAEVQRVVDRLRATLGIADDVQVAVVESNPTIASVRRAPGRPGFLLSIERGFLQALSTEELDALLAHELGHVWIFTHHPFLQTEQLANRVAMRLVSVDDLRRVYAKVWTAGALSGDLEVFLGVARTRVED